MPNEQSAAVIFVGASNRIFFGVRFSTAGRREAGFADPMRDDSAVRALVDHVGF
ncbi:hypothetical protein [Streptomyces canus]|uniref:hypothetical protein n=1 Tax=Streptomyces canus TaxID=58343 RepID=UPI00225AB517|nr:hypothetical protein [Streptomyces canus]MCX4852220.1 hypothetical protein [Streptomyces canus]